MARTSTLHDLLAAKDEEIERLTRERDEARDLARQLLFPHLPYTKIRVIREHPWMNESEGEG